MSKKDRTASINWMRRKRVERRAAGLCPLCGRTPRDGFKLCSKCNNRELAAKKSRKDAGICTGCKRLPATPNMTYCQPCLARRKSFREVTRSRVIAAYGGRCSCCGESDPNVLQLDHIKGGGNAHRRMIGDSGHGLCRWAVAHAFPKDVLQLLCANCHMAKTQTGDCTYRATTHSLVG